ncbi:peritrophin-1-like [Anoplophora glabripennis]|uniref:peritrophin-1-like n=1 Tax=Anoplophora glabripennis TaxID=217634 RepID=UPI0008754AF2|nr:peritrophin-1-like [Anoplophora glabripennis]
MYKLILILALVAVFAFTSAEVVCPKEEQNSDTTYFPHETDCTKFYECTNGRTELLECPPKTYWDTTLNVCDTDAVCGNLETSTAQQVHFTRSEN